MFLLARKQKNPLSNTAYFARRIVMPRLLTVIGARPQFVKAAAISSALKHSAIDEILVHTGQHYDANMSAVFFDQLGIPKPAHILDINGGSHAQMTAKMLLALEAIMQQETPDAVMVYGDTNSTLAGALAAVKLHIPVVHVEAGLRSFNMQMPEEVNRILTDRISQLLLCPTDDAVMHVRREAIGGEDGAHSVRVVKVGDVMQDAAMMFADKAMKPAGLNTQDGFILATCHRAENTDDPARLCAITDAIHTLVEKGNQVILPLHPRTKAQLEAAGLALDATLLPPLGYLEMLWLLQRCRLVLTDSGGLQKEAFFFKKPCVTMRDETEWMELVQAGYNRLAGANKAQILQACDAMQTMPIGDENFYGNGRASAAIVDALTALLC
jgi:UDP-GlcNAc3NAcA epimerase